MIRTEIGKVFQCPSGSRMSKVAQNVLCLKARMIGLNNHILSNLS